MVMACLRGDVGGRNPALRIRVSFTFGDIPQKAFTGIPGTGTDYTRNVVSQPPHHAYQSEDGGGIGGGDESGIVDAVIRR